MNYLHVDRILDYVGNGSTEPLDVILSTNERSIVKVKENIQGNLSLVNEYICYRIANILKLPIPIGGIGIIDDKTIVEKKGIITDENHGHCFFSNRINKATLINHNVIHLLKNKNLFTNVLLFDHLVYNKDRNDANLLITIGAEPVFYIIDHTHVFKNQTIWNKTCLKQGMISCDFQDREILEYNKSTYNCFMQYDIVKKNDLFEAAQFFQTKISKDILKDITEEVPSGWIQSREDLDCLVEYLMYRLEHMHDFCALINDFYNGR